MTSRIKTLNDRLADLNRDQIAVAAELRAYQDMLDHMSIEGVSTASEVREPTKPFVVRPRPKPKDKSSPSEFEMSKDWLKVMNLLIHRGRKFTASDMVEAGQEVGFDTKSTNARSQLAFYSMKGYVRRISRGIYSVTTDGKDFFLSHDPGSAEENDPSDHGGLV